MTSEPNLKPPFAAYDANLVPMTSGPILSPADLDVFQHRAVISNDQPATYGMIWVLNDGASYAAIPPSWIRLAATEGGQGVGLLDLPASRDRGRCAPIPGLGILLLAHDPAALQDVQRGLSNLFRLFGEPLWRMQQA